VNWTELLNREIESTYTIADKLFALIGNDALEWKPSTGSNWMTTGQLLKHMTQSCGPAFQGFVKGDWGLPPAKHSSDGESDEHLPPAEKLPTLKSVAEARQLLHEDKQAALEMLAACRDEELAHKKASAPWDSSEMELGYRLFQMVDHLKVHKAQLFYYLKLQGKPVSSRKLWGI
jgi:uncharacterized damage-inducible protein DinB